MNRETWLRGERLEVLADLLPGLIHELNSPLSVLLGQAQVLQERLASGPEATGAARLSRAAERCAEVSRQLATLAQDSRPERTVVCLDPLVDETLALFACPLRAALVKLERERGADVPSLFVAPRDLRLLVATLVRSALHGVRDLRGERVIEIRTRRHPERPAAVFEILHDVPTTTPGGKTPPSVPPPSLLVADQIARDLGGALTRSQDGRICVRVEFATARLVEPAFPETPHSDD